MTPLPFADSLPKEMRKFAVVWSAVTMIACSAAGWSLPVAFSVGLGDGNGEVIFNIAPYIVILSGAWAFFRYYLKFRGFHAFMVGVGGAIAYTGLLFPEGLLEVFGLAGLWVTVRYFSEGPADFRPV